MNSETEFELLDRAEEVSVSARSDGSVVIFCFGTIFDLRTYIRSNNDWFAMMDDSHATPPMLTSVSGCRQDAGTALIVLKLPDTFAVSTQRTQESKHTTCASWGVSVF